MSDSGDLEHFSFAADDYFNLATKVIVDSALASHVDIGGVAFHLLDFIDRNPKFLLAFSWQMLI